MQDVRGSLPNSPRSGRREILQSNGGRELPLQSEGVYAPVSASVQDEKEWYRGSRTIMFSALSSLWLSVDSAGDGSVFVVVREEI